MEKISKDLDQKIRRQAKSRCGYCLNPQELLPFKLEIEHIYPQASGGKSVEENLWLACRECNAHEAAKIKALDKLTGKVVKLFNPKISDGTLSNLFLSKPSDFRFARFPIEWGKLFNRLLLNPRDVRFISSPIESGKLVNLLLVKNAISKPAKNADESNDNKITMSPL